MKKFLLISVMIVCLGTFGMGQQVIGSFPSMDGGFEMQSGTLATASSISTTQSFWTVSAGTGVVSSTGGRSGPKYTTFTQTGTSHRRLQSSTADVPNGSYIIQFYYQGDLDGGTFGDIRGGASANGTGNAQYSQYATGQNTGNVWTKYYSSSAVTLTNTALNLGLGFVSVNNSAQFKIDDFVIYAGTVVDVTAPNSPGLVSVSNPTTNSLDVSWIAATGGVDGGGYVVVRYGSDPGTGNDPNQNGIYSVGNTVAGTVPGTVRYIGTGTSFTDNSLISGTQYWYRVYTVDKAFNYSTSSSATGSTNVSLSPTITVTSSITGFGPVTVNTTSTLQSYNVSGINLTGDISITPPAGYEISTTNSPFTATNPIILNQVGGSIANTTIYVRFKPTAIQNFNGNISHTSPGATQQDLAVTGNGISPSNPTTFTAAPFSTSQINLSTTANSNSNNVVIVYNATGVFTSPVDGTPPGLVGDAFAGGTLLYSGIASSSIPHTGLGIGQTVYYKCFSADNLYFYSAGIATNARTFKTAPTVQAFNIVFPSVGNASMTLNWTIGDGDYRIVKINTINSFSDPVDGTSYTANTNYSGSGEQVIYNGNSNSVTVTGLGLLTTYWYRVYEYNNSGTNSVFLTTTANDNPKSRATINPPFLEDFETGTKAGYAAGDVLCTMGQWNLDNALLGTDANDHKNGLKCVRFNTTANGAIKMNFDRLGAGNITVVHAKYGTDPSSTWKLQLSTDQGATWTDVGSEISTTLNTLSSQTFTVNQPGNVRIKIVHTGGGRLNIDDISISDYAEPTTTTWVGSNSTKWDLFANWNSGVPGSTSNVIIESGTYSPIILSAVTLHDLTINSGSLTIDAGKALTVAGNTVLNGSECLILKADATGYASFIDNGITGTGTMKAECYLVPEKYHYISAPISNATANVFLADYLRASDPTTSTGWAANYIVDPSTALQPARGYYTWKPLTNSSSEYFSGNPNTGTVSISLNRTATDPYAGWHLVGNPYPSSIDLENGINWGNFENTAYFFDPVANNYSVYETWGSYGTHSQYCPPQQGFFAHIDDAYGEGNTTLSFTNASRVHNSVSFLKESREIADFLLLTVTGNVNSYSDKAIVHFDENVTRGFDKGYDGYKLAGASEAPQLYTISSGKNLTCNALPFDAKNISIPMEFSCGVSGSFTISADSLTTFANNTTISLEDKKLNIFTDLKQSADYTFSYTTNENPDRFVLHFYNPNIGTGDLAGSGNIQIFAYSNQLIVRSQDGSIRDGKIQVYDMTGRLVYQGRMEGGNSRISLSLAGGYYIARVTTAENVTTEKFLVE